MAEPIEVMAKIDHDLKCLDVATKDQREAIKNLAQAEVAYLLAYESELIKQYVDAKDSGTRLPAEDVRKAIAHKETGVEKWKSFLILKADVEALKQYTRSLEHQLSARQSLLSALKAEAR